MNMPDNPYYRQMELLVRMLPSVTAEECFALKGGTAINLFYHDLPRYSVDIDLTYMPIGPHDSACREIDAALRRIGKRLSSGSPFFGVALGKSNSSGMIDTLRVDDSGAEIKIETNSVLRGAVYPARELEVKLGVKNEFGFASANVLSREDVYAGKLVAALDRQHPRDLFDVKLLFDTDGVSDALLRTFLVYLVGHRGSIPDVLAPRRKDISRIYHEQFVRMTVEPVSLDALLEIRERLIREIHSRLDDKLKQFLLSVQRREPEWTLLGLQGVEELPAVKWRLLNLGKMSSASLDREIMRLEGVLSGSNP